MSCHNTQGNFTIEAIGREVQLKLWSGPIGASTSMTVDLSILGIDQTIAVLVERRALVEAYIDALPLFVATYPTETEQLNLSITPNQLLVTDLDDLVKAITEPVPGRRLGNAISVLKAAGYEIVDSKPSSIDGSLEYSVRAL